MVNYTLKYLLHTDIKLNVNVRIYPWNVSMGTKQQIVNRHILEAREHTTYMMVLIPQICWNNCREQPIKRARRTGGLVKTFTNTNWLPTLRLASFSSSQASFIALNSSLTSTTPRNLRKTCNTDHRLKVTSSTHHIQHVICYIHYYRWMNRDILDLAGEIRSYPLWFDRIFI